MRTASRESGESLLEVVMAVAIIGIAFSAILGGLGTAVLTSGVNQQQAADTNYVRALAERVEALAPFSPCYTSAQYDSALSTVAAPAGVTRSVQVEYWDGTAFTASCSAGTVLHRVTIKTGTPDARATNETSLQVLKRKP